MQEKWKQPPIIKVYEALGAVADGRVEVSDNVAKVHSSSRKKSYDVTYDAEANAIMANDNGSYWQEYLGYPSIAFLLQIGVLPYRTELAELLKGIQWKDINQKFKNDFEKTRAYVEKTLNSEEKEKLTRYTDDVSIRIGELGLTKLGTRTRPPKGY